MSANFPLPPYRQGKSFFSAPAKEMQTKKSSLSSLASGEGNAPSNEHADLVPKSEE